MAGLWCIYVSLGAKGRKGEKQRGPLAYISYQGFAGIGPILPTVKGLPYLFLFMDKVIPADLLNTTIEFTKNSPAHCE
jgi:hypothetical protein